jgi:arginine:pyruvate transaminase
VQYSSIVDRIAGKSVSAWNVHYEALARVAAGEDVIVLSVGQETNETTPRVVVEAGVRSMRAGRHHYTDVQGELALRELIATRHRERTGQRIGADRVSVFSGAQNALFAAALCLLERGDEAVLLEPYYTTYPATFSAAGASLVEVATRPQDGFQFDVDDVVAATTARTRAIVVNTPNNPTGAIYSRDSLAELVAFCASRDIWLISDEVYSTLAAPGEAVSPCGLPGGEKVCVTVSSLSKSHRMTGWRIGWVVGPPGIVTHLYNLALCMSYGLPMFTQDAAVAALQEADHLATEIRDLLNERNVLVREHLRKVPGLGVIDGADGMYVVLDIGSFAIDGERFAQGFLDRHDVSVLPCHGFGSSCDALLRISLCEPPERLADACERLRRYVVERGWDRSD